MKVGLIGCGEISQFHMKVYQKLKNVDVVAVSDLLLDRAKAFAEQWGVNQYFADYHDLLEVGGLDFVDVCTPVWTHPNIAMDIAESGVSVLLEKPMALSSEECDQIISTVKKYGVKLCVNHHSLFNPSVIKAKALVESGYIDLQSVQVKFFKNLYINKLPKWAYKAERGGLLWEVGTHPTYLAQHFLPDVKKVFAVGRKGGEVFDGFSVLMQSSDDSFGVLNFSFTTNYREYSCQLTGQNGHGAKLFIAYDAFLDQSEHISKTPVKFLKEGKNSFTSWTKAALRGVYHRDRYYDFVYSKYALTKRFVDSLKNGAEPPVPLEDSRFTIVLLEGIKKSLETGKAVPIE